MVASPLAALATSWWLGVNSGQSTVVLWIETFGVVAFVAFWATKTFEMRDSDAERRALNAGLKRVPVPPTAPMAPSGQGSKSRGGEKVVPAG